MLWVVVVGGDVFVSVCVCKPGEGGEIFEVEILPNTFLAQLLLCVVM